MRGDLAAVRWSKRLDKVLRQAPPGIVVMVLPGTSIVCGKVTSRPVATVGTGPLQNLLASDPPREVEKLRARLAHVEGYVAALDLDPEFRCSIGDVEEWKP